ncbi:nuclear transport factor 2 family protein [Agromyces sp. Marseille-P2726]|uniref:nuclear transport factor 2 family protein n=1 Tax=Agromyces sp. Marseille-P2726 TaxID=2709132 RepID=UPI00156EB113|nr:nuclear transport factor 2 family protein [Agromyces sp. Marseille-P2726]
MVYDVTAEERNQISQGLYAYCRGLDRFDRGLALSPFADDARLVYSGIFEGSPAEFMDWIWPIHARMLVHVHRVVNIFIERNPAGDLVSESYVQVLLRTTADDGTISDNIGNGRYIDRWADQDGRLVIVERDYVRDATRAYPHEQKDLSAVRPESSGAALAWARDESDASYRLLRA